MKGVSTIFINFFSFIWDVMKTSAIRLYKSGMKVKASAVALIAVVALILGFVFSDAQLAYHVDYNGRRIATVKSKKHFTAAVTKVLQMVDGDEVEDAISDPEFSVVLVQSSNVENSDIVADKIIENSRDIVKAATLIVNGRKVACVQEDRLNRCVQSRLNEFGIDGSDCTLQFVDNVEIESGYYLSKDIDDFIVAQEIIGALDVKTEATVIENIDIAYSTKIEKNSEMVVGEKKVKVQGVNGQTRVTRNVVAINGNIISSQEVSTEVVKETVNEVVVVGTSRSLASAKSKQQAHQAGFIFPLPAGSWRIGAYYGDGRNHKGIDICASKGTATYAVGGGTVVHAATKSGYGYCVIIDHGNGIQTLYAHASALCVKNGDVVNAGDVVALVGSTGNSSGNHLHFEVKVGGRNVDPAPYINLD